MSGSYLGGFDQGAADANEEQLKRLRKEKAEEDQLIEEERILNEDLPRIRQEQDLEENPPLENLEYAGESSKSEHWLLRGLGYVGDRFEDLDRAVLGRVGSENYNLYQARRGTIDWLSEKHFVFGMLGEMFIPDTIDLATAGIAYIPNRFRKSSKLMKSWLKTRKATYAIEGGLDIERLQRAAKATGATMSSPYEITSLTKGLDNEVTRFNKLFEDADGSLDELIDTINLGPQRWEQYGYRGQKPSQVNNTIFNGLTRDEKFKVADSLDHFYSVVKKWENSGKRVNAYPRYWVNPVTNDIYQVTTKGNRYTLDSKNRYFREKGYSSVTQKKNVEYLKSDIAEYNRSLPSTEAYLAERDRLLNVLGEIDGKLDSSLYFDPRWGPPPKTKSFDDSFKAWELKRKEVVKDLEDLLDGSTKMYAEHGYNLANERVQGMLKQFPDASLADRLNVTATVNRGRFKEFKDNLEKVINGTDSSRNYRYPDIIVNYNPKLEAADELGHAREYILRLENANRLHLVNGKRVEADLIQGINYWDIPEAIRRRGSQKGGLATIRRWLENQYGIRPRPRPDARESIQKYIPKHTKTAEQLRKELLGE